MVGAQGQYVDGLWTYAVPWAIYLMKTGDTSFVAQNFATAGPAGAAAQPSIEDAAHAIAADRTGPQGTMEATDDIDTQGYWTVDDYEALLGLAAYRYVAATIGNDTEASWATSQYDSLLAATDAVLGQTITQNKLDYLPCSLIQPNTANRCDNPRDANWTSPFGFGSLGVGGLTARSDGHRARPDADRPHLRLRVRPPAGPPPSRHDGRLPRRLLLERLRRGKRLGRAGGLHPPGPGDRRLRVHAGQRAERPAVVVGELDGARSQLTVGRPPPRRGQGSSPHAWGMAGANKVLLDSLVAQRTSGVLVVGRGVPSAWLRAGASPITVTNYPTTKGQRAGVTIRASSGTQVNLTLDGARPSGQVLFQLPAFLDDVASTSAGTVDEATGTVTLEPGVRHVTVTLRHPADAGAGVG